MAGGSFLAFKVTPGQKSGRGQQERQLVPTGHDEHGNPTYTLMPIAHRGKGQGGGNGISGRRGRG